MSSAREAKTEKLEDVPDTRGSSSSSSSYGTRGSVPSSSSSSAFGRYRPVSVSAAPSKTLKTTTLDDLINEEICTDLKKYQYGPSPSKEDIKKILEESHRLTTCFQRTLSGFGSSDIDDLLENDVKLDGSYSSQNDHDYQEGLNALVKFLRNLGTIVVLPPTFQALVPMNLDLQAASEASKIIPAIYGDLLRYKNVLQQLQFKRFPLKDGPLYLELQLKLTKIDELLNFFSEFEFFSTRLYQRALTRCINLCKDAKVQQSLDFLNHIKTNVIEKLKIKFTKSDYEYSFKRLQALIVDCNNALRALEATKSKTEGSASGTTLPPPPVTSSASSFTVLPPASIPGPPPPPPAGLPSMMFTSLAAPLAALFPPAPAPAGLPPAEETLSAGAPPPPGPLPHHGF